MSKTTQSPTVDNYTLIKVLMPLRGLTQGKLATQAGVNPSNFSGWLRGMSNVLSKERELKLLKELGVHSSRLDTSVIHDWKIKEEVLDRANTEGMQQLSNVLRYLFAKDDGATSKLCLHMSTDNPEVGMIEFNENTKYDAVVFVKVTAPEKSNLLQIFEKLEVPFDSITTDGAVFKDKLPSAKLNQDWPSSLRLLHKELNSEIESYNQKYLLGYTKVAQTLKNVLKQTKLIDIKSVAEFEKNLIDFKKQRNQLEMHIKQLTAVQEEQAAISEAWENLIKNLHKEQMGKELDKMKVPNGGKDNGSAGVDEKRRV